MNGKRLCLLVAVVMLTTVPVVWGQMPLLSPLPKTGQLSKPADPAKFSFVLAGDNRPAHKSCAQPSTPGKIFSAVQEMKPDFVIWSGDTIFGKQPDKPKRIHQQYKEFLAIARTGGVPVFNAPGNHELDDENNVPSDVMKKLYIRDMGATYGAFNFGNSRFIALNGEHEPAEGVSSAGSAGKNEAPGAITAKELAELKNDLDANQDKAHIFLFLHHPVIPYGPEAGLDQASVKALQDLFANYKNISYVVSGHEHMYYNPQGSRDQMTPPPSRKDPSQPPWYLVSGGAGAPLKKNTPGSFFHYLVFKIDGDEITPTLMKVDSSDPCDQK
jgi:hypothetical protein